MTKAKSKFFEFLSKDKNADILRFLAVIIATLILSLLAETGALADAGGSTGADFYGGNTTDFINKSVLTIKIVRFIAIFIVIAGIVWAGAEYAIKDDQRRSASILISAVVGGFAVLLAPTLINFVIGGLGVTDITSIK